MLTVLLAAGEGRRAGGPKALLDLAGRTALRRCADALRAGGAGPLRVVLGARADEVAAAHHGLDAQLVVADDWALGQTASLQAGLRAGPVPEPGFVLHTVDHPLVRADDVRALLAAFAARPRGCAVAVPSVDRRRGHPCVYAAELLPEFLELRPDEPAHRVLRRDPARVHHVLLQDPWLVRDVDDPADREAALAELARGER